MKPADVSDTAVPPLPVSLVAPETIPSGLASDAKGKEEAKKWLSLPSYLPKWSLPQKEGIERLSSLLDLALRLIMSAAFLWMAWWWLSRVDTIICDQKVEKSVDGTITVEHRLSDTVLVALLTTTTINVLGLLYFVANYLFPRPN